MGTSIEVFLFIAVLGIWISLLVFLGPRRLMGWTLFLCGLGILIFLPQAAIKALSRGDYGVALLTVLASLAASFPVFHGSKNIAANLAVFLSKRPNR